MISLRNNHYNHAAYVVATPISLLRRSRRGSRMKEGRGENDVKEERREEERVNEK